MPNGSELVVRSLIEHEVRVLFGVPGDTSIDWYEALRKEQGRIRHVLAADERHAAYMADAYARLTNKPGVCEGPSGGGATYLLPGVGEANRSSVPLIALNTCVPLGMRGKATLTELDQDAIYSSEVKWTTSLLQTRRIPEVMHNAFRMATSGRPGAVHLSMPADILAERVVGADSFEGTPHVQCPAFRFLPRMEDLERIARMVSSAVRPIIVAGGGIHLSSAYDELLQFAEKSSIFVGTSLTGKGAFPESHPLSLGCVGENGALPSANRAIADADLIFFIGTETGSVVTSKWTLPSADTDQMLIHLDIDPQTVCRNYAGAHGLVGDARETLRALTTLVHSRQSSGLIRPSSFASQQQGDVPPWRESVGPQDFGRPLHVRSVVRAIQDVLPGDAVIVSDPGTPTPFVAAYYHFLNAGRYYLNPRAHGALGYAIPGAIGASFARPEATIVALTGDGSALMSLGELATVSRLTSPMTIVVFHNNEYSWIKAGQRFRGVGGHFGTDFSNVDFAKVGEAFGLQAMSVTDVKGFASALEKAISSGKPSLIDMHTSSLCEDVPPVSLWEFRHLR